MTTKRTDRQKTRAAFARAFRQAGIPSLPAAMRANWRNVVMPWRMLPQPVALALIALVALAMVLDIGEEPIPAPAASEQGSGQRTVTLTLGDYIPGETPCVEDAVYDTVGETCIHVDRIMPIGSWCEYSEHYTHDVCFLADVSAVDFALAPTGTVAPATVEPTTTDTPTVTPTPTPTSTAPLMP